MEESTLIRTTTEDTGKRLDLFLTASLPELSRARVQQLIELEQVLVNGLPAKPSQRLRGSERVELLGPLRQPPLRAVAEDIPLDVVFEDEDLAVVNKPAGMMVHAGAGSSEQARSRGTLVNALLHRFRGLSGVAGELRPGIVHRLDRMTSGLMVVAKNDAAHRRLAQQFAQRQVRKTYVALVHGSMKRDQDTIRSAISRDRIRRTRMRAVSPHPRPYDGGRPPRGREAVTHYRVLQRIESRYGKFSLLEVRIETGRTHQIRVHLASVGHAVVGDTLYGAPRMLRPDHLFSRSRKGQKAEHLGEPISVPPRNFLHATAIELVHPRTGDPLSFRCELPSELTTFLERLQAESRIP
jgi:23S rRNA pseudouridine1911/1915/1917 synthase